MNDQQYNKAHVKLTITNGIDELSIQKRTGSDYFYISTKLGELDKQIVNIRNKDIIEQLHFMLGRFLSKENE